MSTISLNLDRHLARTTAFTGRLKARPSRWPFATRAKAALDFVARGVFYAWRNRRYLTTLKLANMAAINVQYWLKTERVLGRPYNMKVESTNICNTKCQLCPTGLGYDTRGKGKMNLDNYKRIIDRVKRFLFGLDLSMWGDPLIVPEIYEMVRYAHDRGIWTYLSSNLHAFKLDAARGQAEALVKSGLDMLTCSLHGASQETFAIYQPGKSFGDTMEKVRHIVAVRDAMGSSTPAIQLNFVVTRFNEHEISTFKRMAEALGCKAVISTASMNIRFIGKDKKLQDLGLTQDLIAQQTREHLEKWLPGDDKYVLKPYRELLDSGVSLRNDGSGGGEQFNGKKLFDCSWPWKATVINWDGTVCTCCGSFDPKEDLGNVFEQSLGEIWNGERYRMARRSFTKKLEPEQAKDNPCATCPGFML